ncbi:hypothetical protein F5Y04DRAFT_197608 [Hypomontagnella monticulosa]|nr:hypothetical protein F5Y04DRAFT_197608 [Hypomontagnella monticulosa]
MGAHPDSGPHTSYKRKRAYDDDDEKQDTFFEYLEETRDRRKSKKKKGEPKETRLRRFRSHPTEGFYVIYRRATSQRFYVLNRTRTGTEECPEEIVELTGSTGNIYNVHITQQPWCTCPHSMGGNQCKHVLYVLCRVLRARFDLVYQLALLSSELREIFDGAPLIENPSAHSRDSEKDKDKNGDRNRKPIEGDCPICFTEFEGEDAEATVWCRATCGQNMHAECFDRWASTKRNETVTCPMCRTPWKKDKDDDDEDEEELDIRKLKERGTIGEDGYINVADQLGISRYRNFSTYYNGPRRGGGYGEW